MGSTDIGLKLLTFVLLALMWASNQDASLLKRGLVALQKGELSEARKDFEQASRIEPQNPFVWNSLAETYRRLRQPQQAAAAAKTAEKTGGQDPLVCHALAMFYAQSGEPGRAAEWEERYAMSPKADGEALMRSANLYLDAGEAQRALPLARQAVSTASSPGGEDLLGRVLIATGDTTEGEKHLRSAWQQTGTDAQISFDLAQALLHREDFAGAAEVLEPAVAAHPENSQLVLALGVTRYAQRRFEEALASFLKVIRIDPAVDQPYLFLGRMLDQAGPHLTEITQAYEAWAARKPDDARAQLLLAKALLVQDHTSRRADELLRRSITLDEKNWEAHYELGALLENSHNYAAAQTELMRSTELNPNEPMPHYHLARVYDRLGQPEQAAAERQVHQRLTAPKTP